MREVLVAVAWADIIVCAAARAVACVVVGAVIVVFGIRR